MLRYRWEHLNTDECRADSHTRGKEQKQEVKLQLKTHEKTNLQCKTGSNQITLTKQDKVAIMCLQVCFHHSVKLCKKYFWKSLRKKSLLFGVSERIRRSGGWRPYKAPDSHTTDAGLDPESFVRLVGLGNKSTFVWLHITRPQMPSLVRPSSRPPLPHHSCMSQQILN